MSKEEILNKKLDEKELESTNGGACTAMGSKGTGNCESVYYKESCVATVGEDSWCLSNDWCSSISSTYTKKDKTERINPRNPSC